MRARRYIRNIQTFSKRKSRIKARLDQDFIDGGIATIPCRIESCEDVISSYSVKNYETLNPAFTEYVQDAVSVIPSEYPVVLDLINSSLTEEEKKTIEETIRDDFAYALGYQEAQLKHHEKMFCIIMAGLIISIILLTILQQAAEIPRELIFVLFWFTADTILDYVFFTGNDLRTEHILAGRLACVKVIFSEKFDESGYTKAEEEEIIKEMEQDR